MNRAEARFLELLPLAMGAICLAFGLTVRSGGSSSYDFTAGTVVLFLTAICIALFCTAATIIQQLIGRYSTFFLYVMPGLGYITAIGTIVAGVVIVAGSSSADHFVAGHVVIGVGLIVACVSTVATASTRFLLIPRNAHSGNEQRIAEGFTVTGERLLIAIPVLCTIAGLVLAIMLMADGSVTSHFVAGHVLMGLTIICAALITLVVSIARQVSNSYTARERQMWPWVVVAAGSVNLVWGIVLVTTSSQGETPGWVMIGLALVCFSILSKVLLLAVGWRRHFDLAHRIPLIPVLTAMICFVLSAFLFQASTANANLAVPARVLVGLGAVCFTLFSIVSILESGTSDGG